MTTLYCVAGLPPSVQLPAADCEMLTGQVGFEDDPEVLVDPAGEPVVVVAVVGVGGVPEVLVDLDDVDDEEVLEDVL